MLKRNMAKFRGLREPVNFYTHFIPAILAIPGGIFLFHLADSTIEEVAAVIYGIGMFVLFSVSSIYHGFPSTEYGVRFWQKCDHCCIYLMIAGSYTPTVLLIFDGWLRWLLFGIVWTIAIVGCTLKIFNRLKKTSISVFIYIMMGCLILPLIYKMLTVLPLEAIFWLLLGGVFYVGGTWYYARDKQMYKYLHSHELWHVFVILGALAHYIYNAHYIFPIA